MKSKMKELEVEQMERTNSSPLCYCGVPAALRTSWKKIIRVGGFLGALIFRKNTELAPVVGEGWLSELPPVFMYHLTTLIAGGCVEAL
ncbi:hypothetical protein V6N13_130185 [Hibiscus sabdariffa]